MLTGQFEFRSNSGGSRSPAGIATERSEPLSDEQLLERFLSRDDRVAEAAFRDIVARHGPMVLGVCRHILNQHQDAEDAFQATFLVLARKAGTIRDQRVLARWLYEVAYRIAMRARTTGVRRRTHERQGGEMAATVPSDDQGWSELRPVLHEEVNRLPAKYRVPVILCYLEGKTNEEAALLLNWPVGTVKGRLSRARDLLRSRLTRRGLALSVVLLLSALSDGAVMAEVVPPHLVDETVTNALILSARKSAEAGTISPELSRLMDYAAAPDWTYRLTVAAAALVILLSVLTSLGVSSSIARDLRDGIQALLLPQSGQPGAAPAPSCGTTDSVVATTTPAATAAPTLTPTPAPAAGGCGAHNDAPPTADAH